MNNYSHTILMIRDFISAYPSFSERVLAFIWLSIGMTAMRIIKDEASTYGKFFSHFFSIKNIASAIISLSIFMLVYSNIDFTHKVGISMSAIMFGSFSEFILKILSKDTIKLRIVNALIKILTNAINVSEEDINDSEKDK